MSESYADSSPEVFVGRYSSLDDRSRRLFTEVIQDLQRHCFVLRGGAIRTDPHFSFIEKYEELVSAYLALGGWRLHLDREQGVARIFHPEGSGRVRFNKDETTVLLALRLLYHEQKQVASESPESVVTVGAIRQKLSELLPDSAMRSFRGKKVMGTSLRRLEQFRIILFQESAYLLDDDTKLVLNPVLEHLVTANSMEGAEKKLGELYPNSLADEAGEMA